MKLKETLQLAWNNRHQIADGFYHKYISSTPEIEAEAARRKAICESNVCGHYDAAGKSETSVIPGKPACNICHCNIDAKANCTFCWCALRDIGQEELWSPILSEEQWKEIEQKKYEEQFKPKQ